MKRVILEWGSLFCFGIALALAILWGVSRYVDDQTYHLRVATTGSVQDDLHILVAGGHLVLCDQFEADPSGRIQPVIIEPKDFTPADIKRGDRAGRFRIPGLDIRHATIGETGYVIWSSKLSLVIPAAIFVALALVLRRRLKRRAASVVVPESRPQSTPA